jgi:hypothetical protein
LIASHEYFSQAMYGFGQDGEVVLASDGKVERGCGADDHGLAAEEGCGFLCDALGHFELGAQDSIELDQDGLTQDQLVVRQDEVENVRTEAPGGEGADQDVGI